MLYLIWWKQTSFVVEGADLVANEEGKGIFILRQWPIRQTLLS